MAVAASAAGTSQRCAPRSPRSCGGHGGGHGSGDGAGGDGASGDGSAPASIHGVVRVKEPGLAARLVYDRYERRSGLIRILEPGATVDDWAQAQATDLG